LAAVWRFGPSSGGGRRWKIDINGPVWEVYSDHEKKVIAKNLYPQQAAYIAQRWMMKAGPKGFVPRCHHQLSVCRLTIFYRKTVKKWREELGG
jgi:hypothetical protein